MPNLYPIPEAILRSNVPGKIYDAVGDYSFLRNDGFALTLLLVVLLIWLLFKIMSVPEVNTNKNLRMWFKYQLDEKFRFAVLI